MSTLILDIETVGYDWESLDSTTQAERIRTATQNVRDTEEREWQLERMRSRLGLSPCTGFVVALGIYDVERKQGVVYYLSEHASEDWQEGDFRYKIRTEPALLREFWEGITQYDTVVTFAGRRFAIPFLLHRSVSHHITPSVNLLTQRFLLRQQPPYHVDLQDELTFYGAMNTKPSLHSFCYMYDITSSKTTYTGQDIETLFRDNQHTEIARYNIGNLRATTELFTRWRTYLAPEFLQKNT